MCRRCWTYLLATQVTVAGTRSAFTVLLMAEPNPVTASRGTDTPNLGVEQEADDQPMSIHAMNTMLRKQWLECTAELSAARADGDEEAIEAALARRAKLGNDFVAANQKLAYSAAREFTRVAVGPDRQDHEQSALLGLWEAFAGTDAGAVDEVTLTDEGAVASVSGWSPEKGTFGNWSRTFITGQTRRSVKKNEAGFAHMSYTAWSQKPAVDRARRELIAELGKAPSHEQVAERAGVTAETVRIVSSPAPVSLSTPLGDEGGSTLGDRVADLVADEGADGDATFAEATILKAAPHMKAMDLFTVLLRQGVTGRPELSVVETADRLGVGRGSVNIGFKRANAKIRDAHASLLGQVD